MKTKRSRTFGRIFFSLGILSLVLFLGCGIFERPASTPTVAKPDTPEVVSTAKKTAQEIASAVPATPSPPGAQPSQLPAKPVPAQEDKATPKAEQAPPETSPDPIASGTVLLDPSAPQDAQTIQGRLAELGFYKGTIDGIWGKGSRAALRKFKEQNSLRNPDKWDKETQIALFKRMGQAGQPASAASSQDPLTSGAVFLDPSKQSDAQTIQARLAELGFYKGGIDGIWGKGSRAAVRAFKEKNSLPNPEKWDKETQKLLFKGNGK